MSDEIAESHSLPPLPGTAQQVALEHRKRHRAFMVGPLIGLTIAGIKGTLQLGWLGPVCILGIGVIVLSVTVATRKISADRMRAAFRDPSAFAVAFWPLNPGDYRRFGSLPLTGIHTIVLSRPGSLRPGALAFVGLDSGHVLHFHVLDRVIPFIAALRVVGVTVLEEHHGTPSG
ncbi:hypothetical protein [Nonomuraea sp. NPDC049141]|uniref:hypothetical protein n=1 Tax=Nonomuraea sp. NPDC049141 TaxID=3155500 RepID=UPI0033EA3698